VLRHVGGGGSGGSSAGEEENERGGGGFLGLCVASHLPGPAVPVQDEDGPEIGPAQI
jgi:hypothetical protein